MTNFSMTLPGTDLTVDVEGDYTPARDARMWGPKAGPAVPENFEITAVLVSTLKGPVDISPALDNPVLYEISDKGLQIGAEEYADEQDAKAWAERWYDTCEVA